MTAATVSNAVAKRDNGIVTVMWDRKTHFAAVLPEHVDVKSFLGTAAAALYASDDLMRAATRNPDSLIAALMRCAALGHQPGTDEFYLTPRKGAILGIEGYRGIVERMYRSGAVSSVVVREVCANDEFDYIEGVHDKPVHKVNWFGGGRGDMIGVYAYATLTTGATSRVVILSRADVMAARDASDAADSSYSPWNRADGGKDHPEFTGRSMWWKTAARRLEPWVPTSAEYRREQLRAASAASDLASRVGSPPPAMAPEVVDAEIVDDAPDASSPATARSPGAQPAIPTPPAGTVGEEAPPLATGPDVARIRREYGRLGYGANPDDEAAILRRTAQLAQLDDLTMIGHLTRDQAAQVTGRLKGCKDAGELDELLDSGTAPEGSDA